MCLRPYNSLLGDQPEKEPHTPKDFSVVSKIKQRAHACSAHTPESPFTHPSASQARRRTHPVF
jgi:hypothetical protein